MLIFPSIDRVLSPAERNKLANILAAGAEFAAHALQPGHARPAARKESMSDDALSGRQRQILYLIQKGKTNREIAGILQVTPKSVKYHVERILEKLKAGNRAQAIAKAIELHIPLGPL